MMASLGRLLRRAGAETTRNVRRAGFPVIRGVFSPHDDSTPFRMSRSIGLQAELVKFAGSACPQRTATSTFLDFMNSLLTKILKVYVDLRRFYYADVSQR